MATTAGNGFFSTGLFDWLKKDAVGDETLFSLSQSLDQLCHTVVFSLKIDSNNMQQVLVASLYLKKLSTLQGVLLLAEKGMINESKTLLRSMLETVFSLVAIAKDKSIVEKFIEDDYVQRLRLLHAYNGLPPKVKKSLVPKVNKIIKSGMQGLVNPPRKTQNITPLTVKDLATAAELKELYYSVYLLLTGSNYLRVCDLDQYFENHSSGTILRFLQNPEIDRIDSVLITTIKAGFYSLNSVIELFKIKIPQEYSQLVGKFRTLAKISDQPVSKKTTLPHKTLQQANV